MDDLLIDLDRELASTRRILERSPRPASTARETL